MHPLSPHSSKKGLIMSNRQCVLQLLHCFDSGSHNALPVILQGTCLLFFPCFAQRDDTMHSATSLYSCMICFCMFHLVAPHLISGKVHASNLWMQLDGWTGRPQWSSTAGLPLHLDPVYQWMWEHSAATRVTYTQGTILLTSQSSVRILQPRRNIQEHHFWALRCVSWSPSGLPKLM